MACTSIYGIHIDLWTVVSLWVAERAKYVFFHGNISVMVVYDAKVYYIILCYVPAT